MASFVQHEHLLQLLLLLLDHLTHSLRIGRNQKIINLTIKLIPNRRRNPRKRLSPTHLLAKLIFTKIHNNLLQPLLQDPILATNIKIIQKLFLPLQMLIFLASHPDKDKLVFLLFRCVQVAPEHCAVLHCEGLESEVELGVELLDAFLG